MTTMPAQSERSFQGQVLGLAQLQGWTLRYHTWSSLHSPKGWVDLVLYRPPARLVFAELKRCNKHPTVDQQAWIDALRACGQEVYVWHPCEWDQVEAVLLRD